MDSNSALFTAARAKVNVAVLYQMDRRCPWIDWMARIDVKIIAYLSLAYFSLPSQNAVNTAAGLLGVEVEVEVEMEMEKTRGHSHGHGHSWGVFPDDLTWVALKLQTATMAR